MGTIQIKKVEKKVVTGKVGENRQKGDGNFLKESKRGFPSPEASFYKISE